MAFHHCAISILSAYESAPVQAVRSSLPPSQPGPACHGELAAELLPFTAADRCPVVVAF